MIKDITFAEDADFKKIKAGVDKLANVVKSTLGPGGTNVILELGHVHVITKDGVTVAQQVFLEDPLENLGAQIVKRVAQKTVQDAGDGTTTATVLAQAILEEGVKLMDAGVNPIEVKRGIDIAVTEAVKAIKAMAKPIGEDDIHKVAVISANGDKEIGGLVGDAVKAVGLEGLVTVEDSKSLDTYLKKVDGMRWDRGFKSPYFVNKPGNAECELVDPVILIYDGTINTMAEMMGNGDYNIISRYRKGTANPELHGLPLLIIAHDFGASAIHTMAVNHQSKAIQACLVEAPDFKDARKSIMHDIAAMTGATVISKDAGLTWKDVKPEHLGRAESVRVTQWSTTIIGGRGGLKATNRAQEIREQMKDTNEHALASLKARLARLVEGLMVIYVGGASEVEVNEKKDRIDDALHATRAAIEEGVLPGGGLAYVRVWQQWKESKSVGENILHNAILVPFKSIVSNVGADPEFELATVLKNEGNVGFNAATIAIEDLVEAGIIDPAKVVRLALENAASVAGMLLTTKAIVSNKAPRQ